MEVKYQRCCEIDVHNVSSDLREVKRGSEE
jgi:hypothetical protein